MPESAPIASATPREKIAALHVALTGRAPDANTLDFWTYQHQMATASGADPADAFERVAQSVGLGENADARDIRDLARTVGENLFGEPPSDGEIDALAAEFGNRVEAGEDVGRIVSRVIRDLRNGNGDPGGDGSGSVGGMESVVERAIAFAEAFRGDDGASPETARRAASTENADPVVDLEAAGNGTVEVSTGPERAEPLDVTLQVDGANTNATVDATIPAGSDSTKVGIDAEGPVEVSVAPGQDVISPSAVTLGSAPPTATFGEPRTSEDGTRIPIELSRPAEEEARVTYEFDGARGGGTATIPAGSQGTSVKLPEGVDPSEHPALGIRLVRGDGIKVDGFAATGIHVDDPNSTGGTAEPPTVTMEDAGTVVEDSGDALGFTFRLDKPSKSPVVLEYQVNGPAGGNDTEESGGTVRIAPGETEAVAKVTPAVDNVDETSEDAILRVTSISGGLIGSDAPRGTVEDDDLPRLITVANPVDEGGETTSGFKLGNIADKDVTIDYTVNVEGGATRSRTATIEAGDEFHRFKVAPADDGADGDRSYSITINDVRGPANPIATEKTAAVRDDDPAPVASVSAGAPADEGGKLTFDVSLDRPSVDGVTLDWSASGGGDVRDASGTAEIPAGGTGTTITLDLGDDTKIEKDRSVTLTLDGADGADAGGAAATGTVLDDDRATSLSVTGGRTTEGGKLGFDVSVDGPAPKSDTKLSWTLTRPGGGTVDGTTTLAAGATGTTITRDLTDDQSHGADETWSLRITDADGLDVADATAESTVVENDPKPVVSVADATADEGGELTFDVSLDRASESATTIDWKAEGSGHLGSTSGSIDVAAGETSGTITIGLTDDQKIDSDGTVDLTITGADGADASGAAATGTVRNDDAPPTASVADAAADEGGELAFDVSLDAPAPAGGSSISWMLTRADGTTVSGTTDVAAGESGATITHDVADDKVHGTDEQWSLEITGTDGAKIGDATATGTVRENDPEPVATVSGSPADEGGKLTFDVQLDRPSASPVTVDWKASGSDALASTSGSVEIAAGSTSGTVTIDLKDDEKFEEDQKVSLDLVGADGAGVSGGASAKVRDNDEPQKPAPEISSSIDVANDPAFSGMEGEIKSTIEDAVARWDNIVDAAGDTNLEIDVNAVSGNHLASARSVLFTPTGTTHDGENVYESATGREIRGGPDANGSSPDVEINLSTGKIDQLDFDGQRESGEKYDAGDVMTHEIGHALGFASFGTSGIAESVFETMVREGAERFWFTGSGATSRNGGNDVALSNTNEASGLINAVTHLSEKIHDDALMTPKADDPQTLSEIGEGMVKDLGFNLEDYAMIA